MIVDKTKFIFSLVQVLNYVIPKRKNGIIFFSRPDYADNCRALYEKMIELNIISKYRVTWVVQNVEEFESKHPGVIVAKHRSLKSLWEMCRARYIIRTHSFWNGCYIPGRQVMCYSFHGMGIKGFEYNTAERYPYNSFDHFNVTSALWAKMFAENLNADIERMDITGLPRNDYLFVQPTELLDKLDLSLYAKRIIWMPTFKDKTRDTASYGTDSGLPVVTKAGLNIIQDILQQNNYCLIIKLHQWAAEEVKGNWENIRVISDADIPEPYTFYHLLGLMDVLLTDYSSVSTDFLLLDRPIGYVYDDIDELRKTRYLPLDPIENYMAGARIRTEAELHEFFANLNTDNYKKKREEVARVFLQDRDNGSSERFLEAIGLLNKK